MKVKATDGANFTLTCDFLDLLVFKREIVKVSGAWPPIPTTEMAAILAGMDRQIEAELAELGVSDPSLVAEQLAFTARQIQRLRVNALKDIGAALGHEDARRADDEPPYQDN